MTENLIKFVLEKYPHTRGNNTEIAIYCWEEVVRRRGIEHPTWQDFKDAIRTKGFGVENIPRTRRKAVKPTQAQRVKEEEYHQKYAN